MSKKKQEKLPATILPPFNYSTLSSLFSIAASERKTQDLESSSSKLEKELLSLKNDRAEQSKLIKKFQRKLLLVTKVRGGGRNSNQSIRFL